MGSLFSQVQVVPGRRWIPAFGEHHASLVTLVLTLTFLSVGLAVVFINPFYGIHSSKISLYGWAAVISRGCRFCYWVAFDIFYFNVV